MWRRKLNHLTINVPEADFRLETPKLSDYLSWKSARERNREHLQPFEPVWKDDAFLKSTFRRFVEHAQNDLVNDGGVVLFLKRLADDEVIGGINLRNIRRGSADMGTLGYWIASEYGGAGRMKRSVARVVEFGFWNYELHRIEAACVPENESSAKVLLANGFEEEGFAKSYLRINGKWRDHRLFGLVRPDHAIHI